MKQFILVFILIFLTACNRKSEVSEKLNTVNKNIEHMENRTPFTEKQIKRKSTSEQLIQSLGIPVNPNLPFIESDEETTLRTPNEVAKRVCVLAAINTVAFDDFTSKQITSYLKRYNLWSYTTEKEKKFLSNPTTKLKRIETWKAEGIWILLWSLKVIPVLGSPTEIISLNTISPSIYPFKGLASDPNIFIREMIEMRSTSEILEAADLYYRIDWACVDARINNKEMLPGLESIVYERHYALNWLINYMEQEWDDVTCDT